MRDFDYLLAILIMAAATLLLRALPFLARHWLLHQPRFQRLAQRLPVAMMVLLTLYAMGIQQWQQWQQALPSLLGVTVVAGLQLWRRQPLLSILAGTACYMLLVNLGIGR
ncbi:branched-chain amino acid transporter permease [Pseudaeromonas sharmana]|uniref:Branched-chain amino acid transporter permease n=1 Tax=Pseudaeromonas sharmana TaxID=328412 RepID=A0ABV8CQ23_9GAMM